MQAWRPAASQAGHVPQQLLYQLPQCPSVSCVGNRSPCTRVSCRVQCAVRVTACKEGALQTWGRADPARISAGSSSQGTRRRRHRALAGCGVSAASEQAGALGRCLALCLACQAFATLTEWQLRALRCLRHVTLPRRLPGGPAALLQSCRGCSAPQHRICSCRHSAGQAAGCRAPES